MDIFGGRMYTECNDKKISKKNTFKLTEVLITAKEHKIPATICMPDTDGVCPVVVMLHGTGSNRDEAGNGYKLAAQVFAMKYGIATIRFDFMGSGDSTANSLDYNFSTAIADVLECVKYICAIENVDAKNIGIMGWSQGGTIALLSAARNKEMFKSIVTWAGAPDLGILLTDELYKEAKENGHFVMNFDWRTPLHCSLQWCEDVKGTNVLEEFAAFDGPVLAIHGLADDVVDPVWSERIVSVNKSKDSRVSFIEGMDHAFNTFLEPECISLYKAIDETGEFFAAMLI